MHSIFWYCVVQTCMDTVEVILSDWHDTAGTKSKKRVALLNADAASEAVLLLLYESWRCHHNDNLTKDSWMAFTILIFESDMRIKYRL